MPELTARFWLSEISNHNQIVSLNHKEFSWKLNVSVLLSFWTCQSHYTEKELRMTIVGFSSHSIIFNFSTLTSLSLTLYLSILRINFSIFFLQNIHIESSSRRVLETSFNNIDQILWVSFSDDSFFFEIIFFFSLPQIDLKFLVFSYYKNIRSHLHPCFPTYVVLCKKTDTKRVISSSCCIVYFMRS